MSVQAIAAVASMPHPMPYEKNRSSRDFKFLKLPSSGDIAVSFQGVSDLSKARATLMHDIGGGNDKIVCSLTDGINLSPTWVEIRCFNDYIATPEYALDNLLGREK